MKSIMFCILALLLSTNLFASGGTAVHVNFVANNVGPSTWVPVVTSSSRGIKGISVFSSAALPLEIGISGAGAAGNAEVRQMIVPAMLSAVGAPGAVYYPMSAGYGSRISIRTGGTVSGLSTNGTINSGVMDMSIFYN